MRSLQHDLVAGEVSVALAAAGVDSMLIKGAATAKRLYTDGTSRPYVDCDLLVAPADVARSERVLAELGFGRGYDEDAGLKPVGAHAHAWRRERDDARVDLHWSLFGVAAPPERLWQAFRARARTERIGGRELAVPDDATLALVVALHLAAHGTYDGPKPLADARRAVAQLDEDTWRSAARMASDLGTGRRLGAAVRLAGGDALADRLGLDDDPTWRALVDDPGGMRRAVAIEELARASGWRERLWLLRRSVLPPRATLEFKQPWVADYGPVRMAGVHARRLAGLAMSAPAILLAWRRGRSRARP